MSAKNLGASGVLYTDRRDFYISPRVTAELWTDVAPFTTIVSNRGVVGTPDPDYKMFEHRSRWQKQQFQVNGSPSAWSASGAPGGTVTVDLDGIVGLPSDADSSWLGLEVEIFAQTGGTYGASKGVARIHSVTDTDTVVLQSLGNPTNATFVNDALADNDYIVVMGNAFGEGTSAPEANSDELEIVFNSSQIFKTSVEVTGTLYQAALRGYSDELARLRLEKSKEHKIQKERAFLFGMRASGIGGVANGAGGGTDSTFINHQSDADSKVVRTTMGIIQAIRRYGASSGDAQNIFSINEGTYKYGQFVEDTEKIFQYIPTSGFLRALCGQGALSYWNKLEGTGGSGFAGKSSWTVNLSDMKRDRLGFNYKVLETPHGLIQLIYAPALRGPYHKTMLVINDEHFKHVQYRPSMFQANIKTDNAYDGVKDQYFSDEGLGMTLIETNSLWTIA